MYYVFFYLVVFSLSFLSYLYRLTYSTKVEFIYLSQPYIFFFIQEENFQVRIREQFIKIISSLSLTWESFLCFVFSIRAGRSGVGRIWGERRVGGEDKGGEEGRIRGRGE